MAVISSKAAGRLENKAKYNGKEKQDKEFADGTGLEWMDYGARMYDGQVGRWWVVDHHSESFSNFTGYNYALNNPMNINDPDGKDALFTLLYDSGGNLIGVNVSTTVYIRGSGASVKRAKSLTQAAHEFFQSKTMNGISVSFSVNYVFNESLQQSDLGERENILSFSAESPERNRSHTIGQVEEGEDEEGYRSVIMRSGNEGTIFGSGKEDRVVFHETGHFLGLVDRYAEYSNNLGSTSERIPGWENDVMAGGNKFSGKHYESFIKTVPRKNYVIGPYNTKIPTLKTNPYTPDGRSYARYENNKIIDIDSRGRLIHNISDPYKINSKGKVVNYNHAD